jgi:ribosomal protein S18 acetylase RimI-like enzyme
MITIFPISQLQRSEIEAVISPFTSDEIYQVNYFDTPDCSAIELKLVPLARPHIGLYPYFDDETFVRYNGLLKDGFSFTAYHEGILVGFIIAEPHHWNNSLSVWEFHVADRFRRQGIGRRLMEAVVEKASAAGLRVIVCETQNTNVTAIKAYRAMGFRVEGIDISFYTNEDYPNRDMAVFMKRRL